MGRKRKEKYFNLEENRYGLFMNDNSFNLDIMYGRNYLKSDIVHIIKLHKIDVVKSVVDDLYNQAKPGDKKYFAPIEISVMIGVDDVKQEYYGKSQGGITRQDTGPLTIGVYLDELKEKNIDFDRGDIVEYNMSGKRSRYYEVEDAHVVTDETSQTIAGFKPYWKRIIANPVKEDITPYLKGDALN